MFAFSVISSFIFVQIDSEKLSASPRGSRRASESAAMGTPPRRKRNDYDHLEGAPQANPPIQEDVESANSEDSTDSPK